MRISRKWVILYVVGFYITTYLALAVYVALHTSTPNPKNAATAIILGARGYKEGKLNPCLASRVTTAENLYKNHTVSSLIVSGGNDSEDGINEAKTMKEILITKGIPSDKIILEPQATSTYENLVYSQKLMRQHNLSSAVIVTEPFHIARAQLIATSLGIRAQYAASENSPCWTTHTYLSRYFLKEPIAIGQYILTGKIHLSAFF